MKIFLLTLTVTLVTLAAQANNARPRKICTSDKVSEIKYAMEQVSSFDKREFKNEFGISGDDITGYGIAECPAFWAAKVLGKPYPKVMRPPKCGMSFGFQNKAAMKKFAQHTHGSFQYSQDADIPVCGKVTGPIFPQ